MRVHTSSVHHGGALLRVIGLAVVALAAACGNSAPTHTTSSSATIPPASTGVHGRVTAGPTCPVERANHPCPPDPVKTAIAAVRSDASTAAATNTDADGRYALALTPGRYTLHVRGTGPFPRCPETTITVTDGPATTVDIACDTGIR